MNPRIGYYLFPGVYNYDFWGVPVRKRGVLVMEALNRAPNGMLD